MVVPGLPAALLAAILAATPPASVPNDMSLRPSSAGSQDMSPKPATSTARQLPPGPTDGVPAASAAAPTDRSLVGADHPTAVAAPDALTPALVDPPTIEGPALAPAPAPTPQPGGACHGSRPCKRLVILGSVSGALGVASVIAGAILAARPVAADPDDPTMAITYRPAGTAVLTIGIGVLATSLLMTLAAVRASRQARRATLAGHPRPAL
jgi:hypothetical protein